jgi:callose synthase
VLLYGTAVLFSSNDIIGIFQMAKELDGILDSSEAEPAKSCITGDGSTSFLEKIITPIYETMAAVGLSINGSIFDLLLSYRSVMFPNSYFWLHLD